VVADWDQGAATAAYAEQVHIAEKEEKEREEAEAAWIAQYGVLVPIEPPPMSTQQGGSAGRGRALGGHGGSQGGALVAQNDDNVDTAASPRGGTWGLEAEEKGVSKRRRTATSSGAFGFAVAPAPQPWQPQEDFVLASVVALLLEFGTLPGPDIWTAASQALAAGAGATSVTGMEGAGRQGRRLSAEACSTRYAQLRAAFVASQSGENSMVMSSLATVRSKIDAMVAASVLPGRERTALAVTRAALSRRISEQQQSATSNGALLLQRMDDLRTEVITGNGATQQVTSISEAPGAAVAGPLDQAQAIAAGVRQGCGSGAARVISGRLPAVVQAAFEGGCTAAGEALRGAASRPANLSGLRSFSPRTSKELGIAPAAAAAAAPAAELSGVRQVVASHPSIFVFDAR